MEQKDKGMSWWRDGWSHWTREGTFKIAPKMLGGSWHFELWFKEKVANDRVAKDIFLATYSFPSTAAQSISEGEHDQALGFLASALFVPKDHGEWNNLR